VNQVASFANSGKLVIETRFFVVVEIVGRMGRTGFGIVINYFIDYASDIYSISATD
jgi:hypothetical protein